MKNFSSIRKLLTENVEKKKISGCCAAVYSPRGVLFEEYVGTGDGRHSLNAHSAFRLASMTKPITAAAVLLCAEEGLLSLSDEIATYLPEYRELYVARKTERGFERGEKALPVKILHLLTHTSGIGTGEVGDSQYDMLKPREGDTLKTAVERYARGLLAFQPNSAQLYSPVLGLDVAARIVEKVTGVKYNEFLRKRIFEPLGMAETSYDLSHFRVENRVLTYKSENGVLTGEKLEHNFDTFPKGYTGGGAGLLSTLPDYGAFAQALLRDYRGEEGLFKRDMVHAMALPRLDERYEGICSIFNWGLGVRVVNEQNEYQPLSVGSFGWSGAYGSHFWIDPQKEIAAVYMHNSSTYGGAGAPHTLDFERAVMADLCD